MLFLFGSHIEESISSSRVRGRLGQGLVEIDTVFLSLQGNTEGIAGKHQVGVEILVLGRAMLLAILTNAEHLKVVAQRSKAVS